MYSGTLIRDLLATVERAERRFRQEEFVDDRELQAFFEMQFPPLQEETVFVGAA